MHWHKRMLFYYAKQTLQKILQPFSPFSFLLLYQRKKG